MLKVAIIDDEPPARRALLRLSAEHGGIEVVGEAGSVRDAAALIEAMRPDAMFLDIEMAGQNGFTLLQHVGLQQVAVPPRVVVVTAYAAHAVPAFDVEAVDFLLKPVLPSRFATAVRKLRQAVHADKTNQSGPHRLRLPTQRGVRLVPADQVISLQADRDYTQVLLGGEPLLLVSRPLGQLAAELPYPPFVRLSRSLVLNPTHLDQVRVMNREHTDVSFIGTDATLTLGRTASALLRRSLPQPTLPSKT